MEILEYTFMQRALIIGALVSLVCPVISFFVVNRNLGFIGVGISHTAFGGAALGSFLGANPVGVAVVFSFTAALIVARVSQSRKISEDTAIGIMFSVAMAMGALLIGLKKQYTVDLFGYLFGNILAVTSGDIIAVAAMGAVVLGVVALFFKEFIVMCFDEEYGRSLKLPMDALRYALLGAIAVTVVMSMKVIGIVLISALLVLPAATARMWFNDYRAVIAASMVYTFFTVIGGLVVSYYLNISSGASIVLLGAAVFLLSGAVRPRRSRF
ncbi:MAG: Manganese transport system membrane protein MntB [bacterium ADurb.Bin236]|nr:MAG: Manganese transport system membrane protein MntB [bacterium ADurb.Bin236]HPN93859.1 metal ABC transporter permease [bacterium]